MKKSLLTRMHERFRCQSTVEVNMAINLDEKYGEGELPLAKDKKARVLHLPKAGKGIPRRRLNGDRNQCPTCQEYFNSSNAFEQHRTGLFNGTRRCLTVVELLAKNFGKTKDDFWLCPVAPEDRERLNCMRTKSMKPAPILTVLLHHGRA